MASEILFSSGGLAYAYMCAHIQDIVRGISGGLMIYFNPQFFFINRLLNFLAVI